jgi:hypothetical protein
MTEIEKVKQEIKMLQSKLALLEEMEKYNEGPAKEAFKEIYGIYPTFPSDVKFGYFKAGYEAAQLKDVGIPECPDEPLEDEYQKPLILYDMLTGFSSFVDKNYICEVVSIWLPDPDEGEDRYACGWNDCVEKLHLRLKND